MKSSEAIDVYIQQRVDKLERRNADIISCRLIVEAPLLHQRKGGLFKIRIDVSCPEGKIEVNREPAAANQAHEDVYIALRDAFNAAERKLEKYTCKRKGQVKVHEEVPQGRISYLSPMEDYGMITTADDREVYFHRNSVLEADFDSLAIGAAVRYREEAGDKGPQASSVKVIILNP